MPTPQLARSKCEESVNLVNRLIEEGERYPVATAAKQLKVDQRQIRHRCERGAELYGLKCHLIERKKGKKIPEVAPDLELPESELNYEDIVERKTKKLAKTREYEDIRKCIPVKLPYKGNCIGILVFGDLHLDDDGCDIPLAREHAALVRENEGVYAISIGDHLNNWIGALARKYASQSTTLAEAHVLADGFIKELAGHWLCLIGGNHDEWGSLKFFLDKIAREAKTRYIDAAAGLGIKLPNGNEVRLRLAHQLPGNSIYNAAHGATRDIIFRYRWEITLCGHTHKSGEITIKQEDTEVISHGIQVSSYQMYNHYAREKQMKDSHLSPCAFLVINGTLPNTHPDMVKNYWDPLEGVEVLKGLQTRHDQ